MLFETQNEYFSQTDSSFMDDIPDRELLNTIRQALQHREPPDEIVGSNKRYYPNDGCEQEIVWSRSAVIWLSGNKIRRQWSFPHDHEEIRAACLTHFEENGTQRVPKHAVPQSKRTAAEKLFTDEAPSVFGPYDKVMRNSTKISVQIDSSDEPAMYGVGSGSLLKTVCIVFRSFAEIYCQDGSNHRVSIPFLTSNIWPLFPVGFAMEQEPTYSPHYLTSSHDAESVLYSFTSPLKPISPFGIAHKIRSTLKGPSLIYQDDLPYPNEDIEVFSVIKSGERVIYVEPPSPISSRILFTVDMRLFVIHCYAYAVTPSNGPSIRIPGRKDEIFSLPEARLFDANRQALGISQSLSVVDSIPVANSQTSEANRRDPSRWLVEETPPPQGWRESQQEASETRSETNDPLSVFNMRVPSFHIDDEDEDEEIVGPECWIQRLTSFPISAESTIQWKEISVVAFNNSPDQLGLSSFAILLPHVREYRVLHLQWDLQIPFIQQSCLSADIELITYPALSLVKVQAFRSDTYDLLILKPDRSLCLLSGNQTFGLGLSCREYQGRSILQLSWIGDDVNRVPHGSHEKVAGIFQDSGSFAKVQLHNGELYTMSFNLAPRNRLTTEILETLRSVLPTPEFNSLRRRQLQHWISEGQSIELRTELDCLWTAMFEVIGCDSKSLYKHAPLPPSQAFSGLVHSASHRRLMDDPILDGFKVPQLPRNSATLVPTLSPLAEPVILGLHLLGQSYKISTVRSNDLGYIIPALLRLCRIVVPNWADYWSRICPDSDEAWHAPGKVPYTSRTLPTLPPDFVVHCLAGGEWIDAKTIPLVYRGLKLNGATYSHGHPFSVIEDLGLFFSIIRKNVHARNLELAEALAASMVERDWHHNSIETLILPLATPIMENLRICQISPKTTYSLDTYSLIDRPDLHEFAKGAYVMPDTPTIVYRKPKYSIGELARSASRHACGDIEADTMSGGLVKDSFMEIKWTEDRRLEEVQLILQSSRTPVVKIQYSSQNTNEHEKENAALVLRISERTLSLPPGRALFTYGCLSNATPEAYAIPKIELSVRIMPMNIVMVLEQAKLTSETKNWTEFHNGVASGLRISPHTTSVESSWIQFSKPSELSAEHAGFLFGLGLNGHLKQIDTWNTFSYLSPKHDQTSMAVLLGLAASNVGSSNHYITRLIAVHTPALLPVRTVDINVPLLTQSAGLISLGLVFLGTGDRRLADIALREISREDIMVPSQGSDNREAYTVSAALAFGMIMVGKGAKANSAADNAWLNRLRLLIHGERKVGVQHELPKNFDLNVTAPGASLALALLYLKSNRRDIADIVSVPTTRIALNTVPPNLLLLRTLAKSLILWDEIQPTTDWVNSQYLPMKTFGTTKEIQADAPTASALDIASYNVIAGACLAMSLKYAGSASADAWKVVVFYYDILVRGVYSNARTYDHSIRRQATRDAVNVLSCAMAIIMAGSGDMNCLQRLRLAHGKYTTPNKFGMHMANHMALGLLFLGGGRYTLGTSDAAVCALLISFYPRFPLFGYDNRFHLQALRHLWVLAVEPRCLITRDVDSRKVILLPVKIKVRESDERTGSLHLMAPTLTHDFDAVQSLRVDSPRYWPIFIDYDRNPQFKTNFIRNQTLWVKRRRGYLGYFEDPHCTRSSFARSSGGAMGDVACLNSPDLLDSKEENTRDFNDFMVSFAEDDQISTFADRLCSDETRSMSIVKPKATLKIQEERAWVTYSQAALMDCFASDKLRVLSAYLTLHALRAQSVADPRLVASPILSIRELTDWYSRGSMPRQPLLQRQLLKSVLVTRSGRLEILRKDPKFMEHLRDYANGREIKEPNGQLRRQIGRQLAFYLETTHTPSAAILVTLKTLYVETVQAALAKGIPPESLVSALMMVMNETIRDTMRYDWVWQGICDIITCWRDG